MARFLGRWLIPSLALVAAGAWFECVHRGAERRGRELAALEARLDLEAARLEADCMRLSAEAAGLASDPYAIERALRALGVVPPGEELVGPPVAPNGEGAEAPATPAPPPSPTASRP
ncbi:MAG: hypothetical protein HY722_05705 [Planctomycetes bacterium]|nr:hypothetical protein [Planctomycetota bacterium]